MTIVTPSYNAAKFLGPTIESALAQTYSNWEMLIVDDGSHDGTLDVVRDYAERDTRIRLIALERNHGAPARPRNIAISHACGEWIAFLDADDIWHPKKLELQLAALNETGEVFACSQMLDFKDDTTIAFCEPGHVKIEPVSFEAQRRKGRIPASSVIVNTAIARSFPFNEDIAYKAVEDYHCWLRILQAHGSCLKLMFPLLMYRRIEGQISNSKPDMAKRIYMVHRHYPGVSPLRAAYFTLTHVLGGIYFRTVKRRL